MAEGSKGRVYLRQVFPLGTDKTRGGEVLCSRWVQRGPQNDTIHPQNDPTPSTHTHKQAVFTPHALFFFLFTWLLQRTCFSFEVLYMMYLVVPSELWLYLPLTYFGIVLCLIQHCGNWLTVPCCFHLPLDDVLPHLLFLQISKTLIWLLTHGPTSRLADWKKWVWSYGAGLLSGLSLEQAAVIWLRCHLVCFPLFLFLTWLSSEALPPALLRGVSELEHVNKHSLDHCIERHTHARCTGSNGVGCGGPVLFLFF